MEKRIENVLPIQNDQPELVFVFGAGASYPDKIPVQSEIIPIVLAKNDLQLLESEPGQQVFEFLKDNFSITGKLPTLEEVFGFIDFHLTNSFSLSSRWTISELINLRVNLSKILHYVIGIKTKRSDNFRLFWETIRSFSKEIAVITTNYDTLIDDAFDRIYGDYLIDYCIDLVNFRYPNKITPFDWWVNPNKPLTQFGHNIPIKTKLIKIHGSLNWKYCSCCAQVGLTPWDHKINLITNSFESFNAVEITTCPFDNNQLSSLIQVPSHIRTNNNHILNKLYDEAGHIIRGAKKLVFIGYSFPEADVHIRSLVRRNFDTKNEVIVINKSSAKDLIHRYQTLCDNVNYKEMAFEKFLKSRLFKNLMNEK